VNVLNIIHLNRSASDIEFMKFMKDKIYPTSEHIKDSGRKKNLLFFSLMSSNIVLY
jgi:hypothetical protein